MIKKKYFKEYFILMIVGFALCVMYYYSKDIATLKSVMSYVHGDAIVYSEKTGVYNKSISVSLKIDKNFPKTAEIYYTLNGESPISCGKKYTDDIELKATEKLKRYELKAVVYYKGDYSKVYKEEYILCKQSDSSHGMDTIYITTSMKNMYDYETGIFVKGKVYDEFILQEGNDAQTYAYGNYSVRGEEWVRDAHLLMFDADGDIIINDDIGIGISGGASSALETKSLKIYADEKYGTENDKFEIDLREEDISYYSNVTEYNSLRLRSGSQDIDRGNIRASVVSALALNSNFDGCTESRRCIIYLNGNFYGIFDIQQNYSDSFLARHYNLSDTNKIEKIKGSEAASLEQAQLHELFNVDLNEEEKRRKLENQIDMDNYLLYYAVEILCGNLDWPNNNYEIWRYVGEKEDNNMYTDGRWRFLLYDVDLTFPIEGAEEYLGGEEAFDVIMQEKFRAQGTSFVSVMRSVYYRDKFITILSDLLNTSFASENMLNVINAENDKIKSAREIFYGEEFVESSEYYVEHMRQYALERAEKISRCITEYFGCIEKYKMNLEVPDGVQVYWNNEKFFSGEKYSCEYYKGVQMVLNQNAYPGYKFQYWIVNNQPIYGESLYFSESMASDGVIDITLVLEKEDKAQLIISKIHSRGTKDYIELTNVGSKEVDVSRYYLTDKSDNLQKYRLPKIILNEGETIIIHGSKNKEALGDYICNFSLREYETLILSDGDNIYDYLDIPRMAKQEAYVRYDNSDQWMFQKKEE